MSTILLRYSKDGGRNWSEWRQIPMGDVGDFLRPIVARSFGQGVQWVFDIKVTDPVRSDIVAASVHIERSPG